MTHPTEVAVIGAGILGLTTARSLLRQNPARPVYVLEKEHSAAAHQTGRNSGVIHSGIYYAPGSAKAEMVGRGRGQLLRFLDTHSVPYELCGKVVVAATDDQRARLEALEARAAENQIATERLDRAGLREHEPHIEGVGALRVPTAGIVDYRTVCEALVAELADAGAEIRFGVQVTGAASRGDGMNLTTTAGPMRVGSIVNCAGLHSDRTAAAAGADTAGVRIMPFRGEYFSLGPAARALVRNLVYPLPDPDFPFLGVHLTRTIDGTVHAGPNAVPAMKREGYRRRDFSFRDSAEIVAARGTWALARRYWRKEAAEIHRSLRITAFLHAVQRLCPEITRPDLQPAPAGVRAQAIHRDGTLLDDFVFADSPRAVHVVNAPSPAATAAFAIADTIAARHDRLMAAT